MNNFLILIKFQNYILSLFPSKKFENQTNEMF
jgi:hypothetical protein